MFKTSSTAGPLPSINSLDKIARKSGLIKRNSPKFSANGFLLSLIKSSLTGKSSLNHLSIHMSDFEESTLSRQAVHQRFGKPASDFLRMVLKKVIKSKAENIMPLEIGLPFKRILVEDCTVLPMHKSNHAIFPGNGNGKYETAGAKVHLITDWLSGETFESSLYAARSADQSLNAKVLNYCNKDDLIVRDMGFFKTNTFKEIEGLEAFWLSRLPASVSVSSYRGQILEKRLKSETSNQFEMIVYLGSRNRHKCRLVATRLSEEQTNKNRRQRHRNSMRHGATANKRGLIRDGWSLLVTNLPAKVVSSKKIYQIYSLRWNIEIQFRGLKQSCDIKKALDHKSSYYHHEALILAAMIYQAMTIKAHSEIRSKIKSWKEKSKVSYEKLTNIMSHFIITLTKHNSHSSFNPDKRFIYHDTRNRKNLYYKGVSALS